VAVLLIVLDLAGTLVFAVEGAMAGLAGGLDVFGLLVVAFVTALGGGTMRDLLIGAVPPNSIRDWRYGGIAFAGGAAVFFLHYFVGRLPGELLMVLDAAGLALFAVAGTEKALDYGVGEFAAALMGTITAVGGGTLRDVLLAQIPLVLRADVYATAALAGSLVLLAARRLGSGPRAAAALGAGGCFVLRVVAATHHWNLPHAL
jgi:uncharacterized membrane protein YeiH